MFSLDFTLQQVTVHVRTDTGEKTKGKYQNRYAVFFLKVVYLLISCSHKELKSVADNAVGSLKLSEAPGSLILMTAEGGDGSLWLRGTGAP